MRPTREGLIRQANEMRDRAERFTAAGDMIRARKYIRIAVRFEDAASKLF